MSYNPTPIQRKMQHRAGCAIVVVGAAIAIAGAMVTPFNDIAILGGAILAAVGNLMRVFAE